MRKVHVTAEQAFDAGDGSITGSTPLTVLSEEELAFKETVQKLAKEKIEPLVRKMDEESHMDKSVIDSLFENGVNRQ